MISTPTGILGAILLFPVILLLSINPDNQRQETKTYDIEAPRRFVPRRVQILPDQFQLMFDLTYPSDLVTLNYLEKRSPQILGDYPLEIILRRAKSADVIRSARISSIEMRKKMFKVSRWWWTARNLLARTRLQSDALV